MYCPSCGTENRDGANFCRKCRKPLNGSATTPVPIPENAPTESPAENAPTIGDAVETPEPTVAPAPLVPLAIGAQIEERFTVLEIVAQDADAIRYRVRDARRCPDCRTENPETNQFCDNCGRDLAGERGTCLLEERIAPQEVTTIVAPAFTLNGRVYTIHDDAPPQVVKPFPTGVRLRYACGSDAGVARGGAGEPDEDSVFAGTFTGLYESIAQPTVGLFIVADGIGGAQAGQIASKLCVQTVVGALMNTVIAPLVAGAEIGDDVAREQIKSAIALANTRVIQAAREKQNDMGTTITLALVIDDRAYIANVGDSRTYLFADGKLTQITRDHSLVASMVEAGQITREDIYTHPQRNYILRSLGGKEDVVVDLFPAEGGALDLTPHARLLLCCDGLWEMVRDDDIERQLFETEPQKICDTLIQRANEAGGEDNISLIVAMVA